VQSVAAFVEAQKLAFPLLSDPDGSVTAKYGTDMGGRPFSKRVTFVLDDRGRVRLIDTKVDVSSHGSDLAERIRELRK